MSLRHALLALIEAGPMTGYELNNWSPGRRNSSAGG
jgi:hypothetical protein